MGGPERKLQLGDGLSVPAEDALESVFGIIGKRGRGKSGLVRVLMEEFCRNELPFVAFDPVGILWGLRSSADGKSEGYPVLVVGGSHGDIPLDRTQGAKVAKAVIESNVSLIVDFSEESKAVYRQFVAEFSDTLYRFNDAPRHVIIEEAPELVPQRVMGDRAVCFEAVERLVSRGRNKGIGVTLVSQRAATIHKDVLTQLDTLIVFGLTSPQDRKALREWVEAKADAKPLADFEAGLAALKRQEAWVWSPEVLDKFGQFRVRDMLTFHPDKTHLRKVGLLHAKPVERNVSAFIERLTTALAGKKAPAFPQVDAWKLIQTAEQRYAKKSHPTPPPRDNPPPKREEVDPMDEKLLRENKELKAKIEQMQTREAGLRTEIVRLSSSSASAPVAHTTGYPSEKVHLTVDQEIPDLMVKVTITPVSAEGTSVRGRLAVLISEGFFSASKQGSEVTREGQSRGWNWQTSGGANVKVYQELKWFAEKGYLRIDGAGKGARYEIVPKMMEHITVTEEVEK